MKLKPVIFGICIIFLVLIAFIVYQNYSTNKYLDEDKAYSSKEQCEETTGKQCEYSMCDYIPAGKTIQEVCGNRPGKGFYPTQK